MKSQASDRQYMLRKGAFRVAVCAATFLLLIGGCGQSNDNPDNSTLSVRYGFGGASGSSVQSGQGGGSSPMIASPSGSEAVQSIIVGAIQISVPLGTGPGGAYTETDVANLTDIQRQQIEDDATNSILYLTIVQLPTVTDVVNFTMPPSSALWQVAAVGTRNKITKLDDLNDNSIIYFGFVGKFYQTTLLIPGQDLPDILHLVPGCSLTYKPVPPC